MISLRLADISDIKISSGVVLGGDVHVIVYECVQLLKSLAKFCSIFSARQ